MNEDTVEFKIKYPGLGWETRPVFATLKLSFGTHILRPDDMDQIALVISARFGGKEVRWNYKGFSQGHYNQAAPQQPEEDGNGNAETQST